VLFEGEFPQILQVPTRVLEASDCICTMEFSSDPTAAEQLGGDVGSTRSSERIKYDRTGIAGYCEHAIKELQRQFICFPALVFGVANRRDVIPNVSQVYSSR